MLSSVGNIKCLWSPTSHTLYYIIYMHALLGSLYRPSGMGPGASVLEPSPHPPQQPAVYSACMVAIIRHVYSFCPFRTSSIVVLASESDVLL